MTLETAPGTQALLDLEDALPPVLAEPLAGSKVPFWPQVRSEFMVALENQNFGSAQVQTPASRAANWRRLGMAFVPSREDARHLRGPRPIVHLVGGTTTHRLGLSTRNWLIGDFLEAYPDKSAVLQWAALPTSHVAFEPTRSLATMADRSATYARFAPGQTEMADQIARLIQEYARLLDSPIADERLRAIAAAAAYRQGLGAHIEKPLLKLLDRLQPAMVIMEDAAYGASSALILALKSRGVRVVEPQHGWIGPSHGAYNFGAAMSTPELAATLPDELLTFGEYWSSGIRVPFEATAIGKPHLEAMASAVLAWENRPNEILLVSSIEDPESSNDFGIALAEAMPQGWLLRFRPHPRERPVVASRYARMLANSRVSLDDEPDLYASLGTARGVVGVSSTALFEALALGCRVFALASPFARYYVGDLFGPLIEGPGSASVVIEGLSHSSSTVPGAMLDAIWKPDATRNFRRWAGAKLDV